MYRSSPGEQQNYANQNESKAQPRPNPESAPASTEAEPGAQRQANDPVSREVADHGCAGVPSPSQGPCGDGLNPIKQLKGGAGDQEQGSAANDRFVRRVHKCDPTRKNQKPDACKSHESSAKKDGGVACIPGRGWLSASDGVAHSDRGSGGDSKRDHVGERDGVERDLVARKSNRSQATDEGSS